MLGKRVFFIFVLMLLICKITFGEDIDPLRFYLRNENQAGDTYENLGRFNISLNSPVFGETDQNRYFRNFGFSNVPNSKPESEAFALKTERLTEQDLKLPFFKQESKAISSSFTLVATFFQDEFGRFSSTPGALGARKRIGRWAVYGEIESRPKKNLPTSLNSGEEESLVEGKVLANLTHSDSSLRGTISKSRISETPTIDETEIPNIGNYYLEATYDFRRDIRGRVSYKRSTLDSSSSDEKLQVEGIVNTSKDTIIKAGYRNQTHPDSREKKVPNNTRVWTEFILKF